MSVGNLKTQGDKGNNWTWQNSMLQLLGTIVTNTGGTAGQDYELVTTYYRANKNGVGYSLGDSITRTQIVLVPTGVITSTIWFNQTTGLVIAAPPIADLDVVAPSSSVIVSNLPLTLGQKNMAGSAAVVIASDQSAIPITNTNLDVALSTRAAEATLATMLTLAGFQARINTLGQKTMANSTPVVLASDQSAVEVKGTAAVGSAPTNPPLSVSGVNITTGFKEHIPLVVVNAAQAVRTTIVGISRTPSLVAVPANTVLSNTVAGKQEVSIRVTGGGNGQIGGVAVPNGTVATFRANPGDTVGSVSYQTGAGTTMIITYLT